MKARHSERLRSPVSIDDAFFVRLSSLIEMLQRQIIADHAASNGLSVDQINAIMRGEEVDFDETKTRFLRGDLRRELATKFHIKYFGTKRLQASSIDDAKKILDTEYGITEELDIDIGARSGTFLNLNLDTKYEYASYDIYGDREFSDLLQGRVAELLRESRPNYAPLHSRSSTPVLRLLVAVSLAVLYLILANRFKGYTGLPFSQLVPLVSMPFMMGLAVFSEPVVKQYRKTFPFCQFEYGRQRKQRDASKAGTAFMMGSLAFPVLLSLVGF